MTQHCIPYMGLGGAGNPIDRAGPLAGRPGIIQRVMFPDNRYCNGYRNELWYDPTEEEEAGYNSNQWINEIGDALFGSIFGLFNNAIETMTGGLITDWLGEGTTLESLLQQVTSNAADLAVETLSDIDGKITGLIADTLNQSAQAMGEFLGLANAQEKIADSVVASVEYLLEEGEWRLEEQLREAKEKKELAEQELIDRALYESRVQEALSAESAGWLFETLTEEERALGHKLDSLVEYNLRAQGVIQDAVTEIAEVSGIRASESFAVVADQQLDTIRDLAMEGIIKPAAQFEASYQAIRQAGEFTPDEYTQALIDSTASQFEMQHDMATSGVSPMEWLRSRRSDY